MRLMLQCRIKDLAVIPDAGYLRIIETVSLNIQEWE
jgi:hypothetical protein